MDNEKTIRVEFRRTKYGRVKRSFYISESEKEAVIKDNRNLFLLKFVKRRKK